MTGHMQERERDWHDALNILCIRLDSIGDVLMTTPAIRALKESQPGRRITLLTSQAGAAVAGLVPEIDSVISYDAPWLKATAPRATSRAEFRMIERLRREKFDGAVIFTVYSQNPLPSAFLAYMASIPLRLAHCRENPYQLLTHWVPDPEPQRIIRHEVRRQLDLVGTIGCTTSDERLSLRVPAEATRRVLALLESLQVGRRPWVVVHPGATAPSRRYPPGSFAQVIRILVGRVGCEVVFAGSQQERELVEGIQQMAGVPSISLAGQLDLAELAALISLAPVLVCNNSGPAHIAAAVGTPVVDLYALTNPQHTPWMVPGRVLSHDVPCKWCYKSVCPQGHHACLRLVRPEGVVQATIQLLGEPRAIYEEVGSYGISGRR